MKLISFIVYFNKKTGKIEKVYDNFANEVNGKVEVIHLGHYYLRQILDKEGIKQSDYMILGVFSEDEYGNVFMNNMRYQTGTFVDNQAVMDIGKKEGKTIMEEKQYISSVVADFVRGSVSEDKLRQLLQKIVSNHNLNIPDIYNQKTR